MLQNTHVAALGELESEHAPSHSVFGFWLYLMTDCVLFASLFAAFAVMAHQFAGGPSGKDLFDIPGVALETAVLLLSSITYGFAMLGAHKRKSGVVLGWLAITFVLGLAFLWFEMQEFSHLIAEGAGPSRSAFLSAFFTLVGTHGLHVTVGLCWLLIMMLQIGTLGFRPIVRQRFFCFGLFWHALDIVWIGVFTIVYLGAR